MKYLALIYSPENTGPEPGSPEFDAYMAKWFAADKAFQEAGVLLGGAALQPSATATRVQVRGGKTETMDGPFAETKEQLGGYYLFECSDLDEALRHAARIPIGEQGTVEVRPLMDLPSMD